MTGLRWLLVVLGLLLLAAVYFLTRYRSRLRWPVRRSARQSEAGERREPVIETDVAEPQDERPHEPPDLAVVPPPPAGEGDEAVAKFDEPAAAAPPAEDVRKVVAIRLVARKPEGFPGEALVLKMREAGLRHGEFGIFHRLVEHDEVSLPVFSVASLAEPGSFDLTKIKVDSYPGVSLFMVLPGPADGVAAFEDMVDTARRLAGKLDGELLDEHGSSLSVQRERYLREEIIQFEHQAGAA